MSTSGASPPTGGWTSLPEAAEIHSHNGHLHASSPPQPPRPGAGIRTQAIGHLQLARVPGCVTAASNVLAGAWFAHGALVLTLPVAAVAGGSVLLYAGGATLNDWFDRREDARERPTRPIPSGRVTPAAAAVAGFALLAAGVAAAAIAGVVPLLAAAAVAALILAYDGATKKHEVLGPATMGATRGANLLLGVALVPAALPALAPFALAYVLFVAAITVVARGETATLRRRVPVTAAALAASSFALLALLLATTGARPEAWPLAALFALATGIPFLRAAAAPQPSRSLAAVKAGVLGLVLLDAAVAASAAGLLAGLVLAALLIPARLIARIIPVT